MPVASLHEAATVLQGAHQAIVRLLAETAPMQRAYMDQQFAAFPLSDEALEALWAGTGWGPFADAAARLIELLQSVEDMERDEAERRFDVA